MSDEPESYQSFGSLIAAHARRQPDKTYLHSIDQDQGIAYADLLAATNQIAAFLATEGVGVNDRVMLLAGNSLEQAVVYLGVLRYGATVCTVNVEMNAQHLDEIIATVGPKLLIHEENADLDEVLDKWSGRRVRLGAWAPRGGTGMFEATQAFSVSDTTPPICGAGDQAVIFYTSGTADKPKGVVYTHATLFYNSLAGATAMGVTAADRVLEFRSCTWVSAQEIGITGPLIRGATSILARQFSRSRYLCWVRDHRVTIGACVPAGINMLLSEPVELRSSDLPTLRYMTSSSAPLLKEDWQAFEELYGIRIAQSYGASELGWVCGSSADDRRIGTVGKPTIHQEVRIVDADGKPIPRGEAGEIQVRSEHQQMLGYLRDDGTIERIGTGGRMSGDLGVLDTDGYLTITGRTKDLIIRGGVNIAPLEIDGVLAEHGDVGEACTIGVPDKIYGEEVVSFVTPRPGTAPSAEAVLAHCRTKLPAAKMPKQVVFRDALPRNRRDKLDRGALRAEWERMQ